jgi:hypothetical protein
MERRNPNFQNARPLAPSAQAEITKILNLLVYFKFLPRFRVAERRLRLAHLAAFDLILASGGPSEYKAPPCPILAPLDGASDLGDATRNDAS